MNAPAAVSVPTPPSVPPVMSIGPEIEVAVVKLAIPPVKESAAVLLETAPEKVVVPEATWSVPVPVMEEPAPRVKLELNLRVLPAARSKRPVEEPP